MHKLKKSVCLILLLTVSNLVYANEASTGSMFKNEWLHYLLFDAIFIVTVWLLLYLCKKVLAHSKQKTNEHFSMYPQHHSEPSPSSQNRPVA